MIDICIINIIIVIIIIIIVVVIADWQRLQVKKSCAAEFTQYAMCLERSSSALLFEKCRNTQEVFDKCMKDNLGLERPSYGYFSLARVHDTERQGKRGPNINLLLNRLSIDLPAIVHLLSHLCVLL